jgi:hypothetical protein
VGDIGYLMAASFVLGVAFFITLVWFIEWLQDKDQS